MSEHAFDAEPGGEFDFSGLLDDLRCHSSEWLEERRVVLVREQRRLHVEEPAVVAVLDERGQVDDSTAAKDGTTTRAARRKRATAKKLKRQPNVAKAAAQGKLSPEQIDRLTDLADGDLDAERRWAEDGPKWSPDDLAAELRRKRRPSVEDADARRAARGFRYWWHTDAEGMLGLGGDIPDIDGALVESVLTEKTKRVVKQRDGHCRHPVCDRRIGLQVHHLWPSSWGGSDDLWNLATVCTTHHAQLAPQGRLLLLGNPNSPAGLSLIDRDDLPTLATLAADHVSAGPDAA